MRVERALSQLIFKEVRFHLKADQLKRCLENSYDFSFRNAFAAIDDWSYGYLDKNNIKRFLKKTDHVATKQELIGILRRYDMDGDAKINFKEFEIGLKSSLTVFKSARKSRPKSGALQGTPSHKALKVQHSSERLVTPVNASRVRPTSSGRPANTRRRETELRSAYSKKSIGPNSNYYLYAEKQEDSSSKTNKAVSFSKAVKVRQYPSSHNLAITPKRA
jgi:hypothetical protein